MDSDDELLLRGRAYGHDPAHGPRPGRAYAELVGRPLDGLLLGTAIIFAPVLGTG
ncbi:hypothetical protein O3Q52_17110 [Streptomyces sp. ActVer]|uniref:hypothetical protein n=1 Tax=Streptomyces sp. ActVer TaxID=3014558 RepID=UPI0022B58392|nr:hypothetical protein [Streptomyces sp. ActVer]MCZ4509887.1 hypothetical protein [Streptomyces sp. ActVer]